MSTQRPESQQPEPDDDVDDGRIPVGRFDWEALVDRAHLPKHIKTVAYVLAHKANKDGRSVRPGLTLVADILDDSEKTAGDYIAYLVELGLLRLVKKGGGTMREGKANLYRLTVPDGISIRALPMRLDPDNVRLIERPKGKKPKPKSDAKSASAQSAAEAPTDLNPASSQSPVDNPTELNPTSDQAPVDNTTDLNPTSGRSPVDNSTDLNPASGEPVDRPEMERRPTRSGAPTDLKPASDYQVFDHPPTNTPRVAELGDHSYLRRSRVIHKPREIGLVGVDESTTALEPPEPAARPAAPTVTDAEYADAYEVLCQLPDIGQFLIARAAREYAEHGWTNLPTKVLAVRAAQLAADTDSDRRSA